MLCANCRQHQIEIAIVLGHEIDRTHRTLIRATAHAEAHPRPSAHQRRVRLQVATALLNAELRDVLGPLPGPGDEEED